MSPIHVLFFLRFKILITDCELKMKTISGIPENCIKKTALHTKTNDTVCRRDTIDFDQGIKIHVYYDTISQFITSMRHL